MGSKLHMSSLVAAILLVLLFNGHVMGHVTTMEPVARGILDGALGGPGDTTTSPSTPAGPTDTSKTTTTTTTSSKATAAKQRVTRSIVM